VVELSPSNIVLAQDRRVLYANPAAARSMGFEKQEDVIGKTFEEAFPTEVLTEYEDKFEISPADLGIIRSEISITTRQNKKVVFEYAVQSLLHQGRKSYLVIGIDITRRKEIELEIEENQRFLTEILNISPLSIFVFDRIKDRIVFFNRATCDIHGLKPEQVANLSRMDLIQHFHPEDVETLKRNSAKVSHLPIGEVVNAEYRWVRPDGEIVWVHANQTAISKAEDGSTIRTLTIANNITEIRNAQEDLRKSEANFRGLVDNIPGMVYQARLDDPFTTTFISDYFDKLTGFRREDALPDGLNSWMKLVHPEDLGKLQNDVQKFINSSKPYTSEYRIRNSVGDFMWVEDTGRVSNDKNNKPVSVNGLIMDITARRRDYEAMMALSQDNLHLLAQARRDAETKTLLLNEVNHRVKNNITSIIGLLELETNREIRTNDDYSARLRDVISRINGLATVHNLLSSNQWAPVKLELFVQQIIENASSSSPIGRNITIEIISQDHSLWINSRQATGLALILNELTTNAVKHAFADRNRGKITVTIRREEKNTNRVRIRFADDGPGWPEIILDETGGDIGMQVIRLSVASPLNGDVKFENHNGAVAIISFNLAPQRDIVKPNDMKK
jgi:PAS domain S-box-containing protein